jgi:hypothetical protein
MVADVDPVSVPLHKRLLVDHHSLGKEGHLTIEKPAGVAHFAGKEQSNEAVARAMASGAKA